MHLQLKVIHYQPPIIFSNYLYNSQEVEIIVIYSKVTSVFRTQWKSVTRIFLSDYFLQKKIHRCLIVS